VCTNGVPNADCCCHTAYCTGGAYCYSCTDSDDAFAEGYCDGVGCATGVCHTPSLDGDAILDPHFTGLNGHKYDFQGEPNKVFALISEPHVQVNARFLNASGIGHAPNGTTVMGDICIRFCHSTVIVEPAGRVTLSGLTSPNLVVERLANGSTSVVAGLWSILVQPWGKGRSYHNIKHIQLHSPILAGALHGVLGVTALAHPQSQPSRDDRTPSPTPHCQAKNEGACEVPGEWHEYEVQSTDLCGTKFKYSKFDMKKCANIVADIKRGVAELSLLQQAEHSILP